MRIGFEIIAVLERAGLALVAIDRHQPRARLAQHRAPFAPGRKAGAAEAAQRRRRRAPSADLPSAARRSADASAACSRRRRRKRRSRYSQADARGCRRASAAASTLGDAGVIDKVMADLGRRRGIAAADAGRAHHANAGAGAVLQFVQQLFARPASRRSGNRRPGWSAARCPARLPSRRRNARRRSRSRTLRQRKASSRRPAPPDARRKSDDSGPGSDADARSADRGAAAGRRAEARSRARPSDRPDAPSALISARLRPSPGCSNARTCCTS